MTSRRIQSANPMHIVLLADDSNSMEGDPAKAVTQAIRNWISELQAATKGSKEWFRFSLIYFGESAQLEVEAASLNDIDTRILKLEGASGTTDMAQALDLAGEVLLRDGATEAHCPPFVFMYTDGIADDPEEALAAAADLKALKLPCGGPRLITIGFGEADPEFLSELASSPDFFVNAPSPAALKRLLPEMGTPTGDRPGAAPTVEGFEEQLRRSGRRSRDI